MGGKRKSHSKKDLPDEETSATMKQPLPKKRTAPKKVADEPAEDVEHPLVSDDDAQAVVEKKLAPSKQQLGLTTPAPAMTPSLPSSSRFASTISGDDDGIMRRLQFHRADAPTPGRRELLTRNKRLDPMNVFCRIRPFSEKEREAQIREGRAYDPDCMRVDNTGRKVICTAPKGSRSAEQTKEQEFDFTLVFDSHTDQATVFVYTAAPLLDDAMIKGQNVLMFAYGVTNSGKTYTMMGKDDDERGIIPRAIEHVFDKCDGRHFEVRVSYLEIYNEKIFDLLHVTKKGPAICSMQDDKDTDSVFVKNLREVTVNTVDEAVEAVEQGAAQRTVGKTALNASSSRSHSVFIIRVIDEHGNLWSKISIVDLAGSERQNRTGSDAAGSETTQKEANAINNSLTTLGRCLQIMRDNCKAGRQVSLPPFRESALTRMFKDSFCGFGRTAMLCAVSMSPQDYDESVLALKYSAEATKIQFQTATNSHLSAEVLKQRQAKKKLAIIETPTVKEDEELEHIVTETISATEAALRARLVSLEESHCDALYELKTRIAELTAEIPQREEAARNEMSALMEKQVAEFEHAQDEAVQRTKTLAESIGHSKLSKLQKDHDRAMEMADMQLARETKLRTEFQQALQINDAKLQSTISQLDSLSLAKLALEARVDELNDELHSSQAALSEAKARLTEVKAQHQQEKASLDNELRAAIAARLAAERAVKASEEQHSTHVSELTTAAEANMTAAVAAHAAELKTRAKAEEATRKESLKIIDKLKKEVAQEQQSAAELSEKAEQQRCELVQRYEAKFREIQEQLTSETERLNTEFSASATALNTQHVSETAKLKSERDELQSLLAQSKQRILAVEELHDQAERESRQKDQIVQQLINLRARFEEVAGIEVEEYIQQQASAQKEAQVNVTAAISAAAAPLQVPPPVKRTRAKRDSTIAAEEFVNSVDLNAAVAPLTGKSMATRKGKRLSVTTDHASLNSKTAPASSIVHALHESKSMSVLASPPPAVRKGNVSPSSRSRTGFMAGIISPAVMRVFKGDKSKKSKKCSNKENEPEEQKTNGSEPEVSVSVSANASEEQHDIIMLSQREKKAADKAVKKREREMLAAAISKATGATAASVSSDESVALGLVFGHAPVKYGKAQNMTLPLPLHAPSLPSATPVAKRTRQHMKL